MRDAGARGALTLRADSGFYAGAVISACRRAGVRFSIATRKNAGIRKAIDAIPDDAWTPIPYWLDGGADVAETTYTAFAGTRHEVTCRLLVRRVRPTPGSQLALDVAFDYHAILTDRDGDLLETEADHRRHAVVEHVVADLKHHAGLAHLPSGRFAANAPWLALVGIGYNLARWTANAAGLGRITTKTLRLTIISAPALLRHGGRRRWLRLPRHWPGQTTSAAPSPRSSGSQHLADIHATPSLARHDHIHRLPERRPAAKRCPLLVAIRLSATTTHQQAAPITETSNNSSQPPIACGSGLRHLPPTSI